MKHGKYGMLNYAIAAALVALVTVLAVLQFRWLGELSRAELDRMRIGLQASAGRFAEDFNMELIRVMLYFRPPHLIPASEREDFLLERYKQWALSAPSPHLVRDVYFVRRQVGSDLVLERVDAASGRFGAAEWPSELDEIRARLTPAAPPPPAQEPAADMGPPWMPFNARILTMIHAFWDAEHLPPRDFAIVRLDAEVIEREVLPELARRYFQSGLGVDYDVIVVKRDDRPRVLFRSDPSVELSAFDKADASCALFAPVPFGDRRGPQGPRPPGDAIGPASPPRFPEGMGPPWGRVEPDGGWELLVRHRAGSLEAAVAGARRRNLAISLGTLLLLLLSIVMLLVYTHRARELARQRMEFVAGVSHELRTPLAVICSAGQNLADGVVAGGEQVKRYGAAIHSEGKRLSELVEQVMEFSELQSTAGARAMQRLAVGDVIEAALADCGSDVAERDIRVEKMIAADLPEITADRPGLQRAIRNLIANAIKYGSESHWVGVEARAIDGAKGREVQITVRDRGPGISPLDLPHIFEPFYRGRNAGRSTRGSGLGLSLVHSLAEAHHGRVSVESNPGGGCSFSLHLPLDGGR
ncbi:MAG: HAMP domain-containing sensor histidine kinase [Acidobacteriota bacterium]